MNHSQKKGLLAVVALLFVVIVFKVVSPKIASEAAPQTAISNTSKSLPETRPDLNTADAAALIVLPGIGEQLAGRIIRYRELIGGYRNVRQLAGIPGMTAETLLILEEKVIADTTSEAFKTLATLSPKQQPHFFNQPSRPQYSQKKYAKSTPDSQSLISEPVSQVGETPTVNANPTKAAPTQAPFVSLDLNLADSAQLTTIKGIGAKTAAAIVKYRVRLGFYISVDHLLENSIIFPDNYARMNDHLFVNTVGVESRRTKINQVAVEVLATHPYLGWREAKLVIAYREAHGKFTGFTDLENIREIDLEKWRKAASYLDFSS